MGVIVSNRTYITREEISRLLDVAKFSSDASRDCCMILLGYIHGLRVSELLDIKHSDIDLSGGTVYIRRLKNGLNTVHPLLNVEIEMLKRWYNDKGGGGDNNHVFVSKAGKKLTRQFFYKQIKKYGVRAKLSISVHPHMLRHGCGYELANQGLDTRLIQDYLGHKNIRHTVIYTASNYKRFSRAWKKVDYEHANAIEISI